MTEDEFAKLNRAYAKWCSGRMQRGGPLNLGEAVKFLVRKSAELSPRKTKAAKRRQAEEAVYCTLGYDVEKPLPKRVQKLLP